MKLLTKAIEQKLIRNSELSAQGNENHVPVAKFFTPDANATWLISEYDPESGLLFGLCDLGMGEPELGYVSLEELKQLRGRMGLPVERDRSFRGNKTIVEYADEARQAGRILI